eukprot:5567117-Amphidinium_carterae.1
MPQPSQSFSLCFVGVGLDCSFGVGIETQCEFREVQMEFDEKEIFSQKVCNRKKTMQKSHNSISSCWSGTEHNT